MFNSLRARLWLSYALLIGVLLAVVTVALVLVVLRNPAVYRSTVQPQLRVVELELAPRLRQALRNGTRDFAPILSAYGAGHPGYRVAVLDPTGQVIGDSAGASAGVLPVFDPANYPSLQGSQRLGLVIDSHRKTWIYSTADLGQEYSLFVGTTLPRLRLVQLLQNDVVAPLFWASAFALLAAALLAVGMGRWIATPLQRMMAASRGLAAGQLVEIPVEGPREVQELARVMNEMHRQVQAGQSSQRDFIANVSHELKTPLTSIQGFAQAILDGAVQTPDALRQAAEVIYAESNRMYRLVIDLLTLARLEAGTADLQRTRLDLAAVISSVAAKFAPQAAAARVQLTTQLGAISPMVGDGDRLAQVFTNLTDNALKFTPPGGRVELSLRLADGSALVEVADTGKGIPLEDKDRIFERFYQLDKSRRGGAERGVGLGLPIARQIVFAHGGAIWVESQPGQGSHFFVRLPLAGPDEPTLTIKKG